MQTYMQRCRLIKTTTGHNKCAPPLVMIHRHQRQRRHKPTSTATITTSTVAKMMRDCKRLPCRNNSKRACYHRCRDLQQRW